MTRSAALLCVRNARKNLHWWIAHHLAVGFDSLLICDDQSDDGTWEFLQNTAHRYDIRLSRTDPAVSNTVIRRETAQKELVRQASQSLNWVLPLTLDEYFYPETDSVHNFITQQKEEYGEETFNLTMSFPINWCIFGLDGHNPERLSSRSPSPRILFTRHAPRSFNDHKIVRFICRPEALFERLPDPFSWTNHEVDWSHARILHDAAASSQGPMRLYYDHNEESFEGALRFINESYVIASSLLHTALLAFLYQLKSSKTDIPDSNSPPALPLRFFEIVSEDSLQTLVAREGTVTWKKDHEETDTGFTPFYLIGHVGDGDIPKEGLLLWGWIPSRPRRHDLTAIRSRGGILESFLDLVPLHLTEQSEKALLINRLNQKVFLPEKPPFRFRPVKIDAGLYPSAPKLLQNLSSLFCYGSSASGFIKAIKESSWVTPSIFASALFALSVTERKSLLPSYLQDLFCVFPDS